MAEAGTWDIRFTHHFQKDFKRLPKPITKKISKKLDILRFNPYQHITNVTRLTKNKIANGFRIKFGDVRLIFKLINQCREILFICVKFRGFDYKRLHQSDIPIGDIDLLFNNDSNKLEKNENIEQINIDDNKFNDNSLCIDNISLINDIEPILIDEDELYLLNIPVEYHNDILFCDSIEEIAVFDLLPKNISDRIIDYCTNPRRSHIGKLYTLEPQQSVLTIAQQPLSYFMLALDPQQNKIINKPLDKGPMLIRGGPGTGKTLINLYRLLRIVKEEPQKDIFNFSDKYILAFITYTNALVNTNKKLFHELIDINKYNNCDIRFSTFDTVIAKIIYIYYKNDYDNCPKVFRHDSALNSCLENDILNKMLVSGVRKLMDSAYYILNKIGIKYFSEEIQNVIEGYNISSLEEYLDFERKGRRFGIKKDNRKKIWLGYEVFKKYCIENKRITYGGRRILAFNLIKDKLVKIRKADVLIVDEVQDFSHVGRCLIAELVKDPKYIIMSADTGQSLYIRSFSWKYVHPSFTFHRGNSFGLEKSYRITNEIAKALLPLRSDTNADEDSNIELNTVFSGHKPEWIVAKRYKHVEVVSNIISELVYNKGINPNQIAIIMRTVSSSKSIAPLLINETKRNGLESKLFNKSEPVVTDKPIINIITAHSAKGLEFPFVILPNIGDNDYPYAESLYKPRSNEINADVIDSEQSLLYVAASRASMKLWLIVDKDNPSRFLRMLNEDDWKKIEIN